MDGIEIILLLLLIAHAFLAIYTIIRIGNTTLFTKKQKRINTWFTVLVPFIWSALVFYILKKESDYNKAKNRPASSNDFYESGIAMIDPGTRHNPE
jgi:hypothetical protein